MGNRNTIGIYSRIPCCEKLVLLLLKEDYMRWFLYAPLQLLIMIICYITNPIVVLFADENGELPGLFCLWQTWDDSCDSEDCVTKYVPDWMRYDFYKYYRTEKRYDPDYGRIIKRSINIAPLPLIDRFKRYCCRVFWLSRNCAYGFALTLFGATINPDDIVVIDDYKAGEFERNILVTRDLKHWKVYNSMRILNTNYRWRIYLGWKIHDVKNVHYAMLAFRVWFCKAN